MEKELIKYIEEFQLIDLLGFGNILGVEECDSFEDYVINIVVKFSKENRKKRKQLLQLAKDIVGNNRDYDKGVAAAQNN